jgi:uncharacterized membrane protein YfcA
MNAAFVLSGALVGLIVGATGVGGGSLMTPLLTLLFGVPAPVAVGTDLLFAAATKAAGVVSYSRRKLVPWKVVGLMAAGSIPASLLTLEALRLWNPDAAAFNALVRPALGGALLITAVAVAFRDQVASIVRGSGDGAGLALAAAAASFEGGSPPELASPSRARLTVFTGLVLGVLVTITSVGAGAIGVLALFTLYPALPAKRLVGADIAHAVPLTLVAGLGHVALGTVNWGILAALLVGSIPSIHLGAAIARRLPERVLRILLATILSIVAVRMLAQ